MQASKGIGSRTRRAAIAFAAVVTATTVYAAAAAAADETLTPTRSAYAQKFRADVDAVTAAGAIGVVAAAAGDNIWWTGASGVRSIDAATKAQPADTTRIGSVTKTMVATLAMQEVQSGRWTLRTTVADVLPGLLPGHGDVTLEELLSHRSGLPDYLLPALGGAATPDDFLAAISRRYNDRELVSLALGQPWLFRPGTAFSYSNTNFVVVGLMLEKANGQDMATLLTQRVFDPAGMDSASFPTTAAWSTWAHLRDYAIFERPYNVDQTNGSLFSSAGAVQATPKDVERFYRALFNGRLLRPALVAQMATPRTVTPPAYGLGIYAVGDPCPGPNGEQQALYGHDGATFGTETLAFTSADGSRQAAISWTGRPLTTTVNPAAVVANDFLVDAFSANCPRPVRPVTPAPSGSMLPSLKGRQAPDQRLLSGLG